MRRPNTVEYGFLGVLADGENRFLSQSSARDTAVSVFGVMRLPEYRYAAVAIHVWTGFPLYRMVATTGVNFDVPSDRKSAYLDSSRGFGRAQSRVSYLPHPTIVLRTLICASVCRQVLGAQVERSAFEERVTPLVPGVSPTKFDGGAPNFDGRSGVRPFRHFAVSYEVFLVVPLLPIV